MLRGFRKGMVSSLQAGVKRDLRTLRGARKRTERESGSPSEDQERIGTSVSRNKKRSGGLITEGS